MAYCAYTLLESIPPEMICKMWCASVTPVPKNPVFTDRNFSGKKKNVCLTITKSAAQVGSHNALLEEHVQTSTETKKMKGWIERIKYMLGSMDDGDISISAYDTAWIALVPALDGSAGSQFPASLQWIIDNQLSDGSWGDPDMFLVHDRIINTLACVVALKTWNTVPTSVEKGLKFLRRYMPKMEEEDDAHTPIGFEIVFPALMEDAKNMNLDLPYDASVLQKIYNERALKMKSIPMEILHKYPSTLLHSLEGLADKVNWKKLLKLQSKDGSFLFSPASTAGALVHTRDKNCLRYLNNITTKFDGGAPNVYPVDLFEHLWTVDRLERLGIARHFQSEITDSLEYVYRYWTNQGIGWARDSPVQDVDDTAMAFRLLRLHGFEVSAEAFKPFKKGDEFICFSGERNQAITGMYNLYRASQILFPGETILEEARLFTKNFLENKQARNELSDKWIIAKGLVGEIEYALNFPWYASQPRIETRMYVEQYSEEDIWIGKSLYRMPLVNNKAYIELAKADFNACQSIHRKELKQIMNWYTACQLEDVGLHRDLIVEKYFLSAVVIFEPDMAPARLAWARSAIIMEAGGRWDVTANFDISQTAKQMLASLFRMIDEFSVDGVLYQGRDISAHLRHTWQTWLVNEADMEISTELNYKHVGTEAEIIVLSAGFFGGELISTDSMRHPDFSNTINLTNTVCSLLRRIRAYKQKVLDHGLRRESCASSIELEDDTLIEDMENRAEETMRQLVGCVCAHSAVPSTVRGLCLSVGRSFYYAAHCKNEEMGDHVEKVLFQPVEY
eukprot:Gb_10531 [translate_table: standard]